MSKDESLSRLIENYILDVFNEKGVTDANRIKLWNAYFSKLSKALDIGYNPKPEMYDPKLAMSLKYNIAEFSAFKENSFRKELEKLLTANGKAVSRSEFVKKASAINVEYNKRWFATEYDQTLATANMADKWQDFVKQKDLYPNLKYVTVGDARVREKHKSWHGLILPIEHHFWKENYPPNDWGCRCNVVQTDEPATVEIPIIENKKGFNNNAAISGKIFKDVAYTDGLSATEINDAKAFAKKQFDSLVYEKTTLNKYRSGGAIEVSNLVNRNAKDYQDLLTCAKHFADNDGHAVEILPTIHAKSPLYQRVFGELVGTRYEGKCPDLKIGAHFYELEGFDGKDTGNKLTKMLSRGLKQSSRLIIQDNGSTVNHYLKVINFRINEGQQIDEVWILRSNGDVEQVY